MRSCQFRPSSTKFVFSFRLQRTGLSPDVDPFVPGVPVSPFCTSPVQHLPPSPGGYPYFGPPQLYGVDHSPVTSPHVNIPAPPAAWHQMGGLPVPPIILAAPHSPTEFIAPAYPSSALGSSPVYQQAVAPHPYAVLTPPRSPQFGPNLLPVKVSKLGWFWSPPFCLPKYSGTVCACALDDQALGSSLFAGLCSVRDGLTIFVTSSLQVNF